MQGFIKRVMMFLWRMISCHMQKISILPIFQKLIIRFGTLEKYTLFLARTCLLVVIHVRDLVKVGQDSLVGE